MPKSQIVDPNGLISDVSLNISEINSHVATFEYDVTFVSAMDTSDVQIYAWDTTRNPLIFTIYDALTVIQGTDNDVTDLDIVQENIISCDVGQLLLDDGTCMDPEPTIYDKPVVEERKCGEGTILVDGYCKVIPTLVPPAESNGFLDWLFSLFGM